MPGSSDLPIRFEWDREKARRNLFVHGVSLNEAATVFGDTLSIAIPDHLHSVGEERLVLVGQSNRHRLLVVVHLDRGEAVRIISARPATRYERRVYKEGAP